MAITNQVNSTTIAGVSLSASALSPAIDAQYDDTISIQHVWTGATGVLNGTLQVQASNDNVNWSNLGTATTIGTASGSGFVDLDNGGRFPWRYLAVNVTPVGVTGGTFTSWVCLKRAGDA